MVIPDNLIEYVKAEAKGIAHGKIIININESNKHIDVTVETTERFKTTDLYHKG